MLLNPSGLQFRVGMDVLIWMCSHAISGRYFYVTEDDQSLAPELQSLRLANVTGPLLKGSSEINGMMVQVVNCIIFSLKGS